MARLISGYGKEAERKGDKDPITRDLLGGCPSMGAKDLDLGLGIGSGSGSAMNKELDILVYISFFFSRPRGFFLF